MTSKIKIRKTKIQKIKNKNKNKKLKMAHSSIYDHLFFFFFVPKSGVPPRGKGGKPPPSFKGGMATYLINVNDLIL